MAQLSPLSTRSALWLQSMFTSLLSFTFYRTAFFATIHLFLSKPFLTSAIVVFLVEYLNSNTIIFVSIANAPGIYQPIALLEKYSQLGARMRFWSMNTFSSFDSWQAFKTSVYESFTFKILPDGN